MKHKSTLNAVVEIDEVFLAFVSVPSKYTYTTTAKVPSAANSSANTASLSAKAYAAFSPVV